MSDADSDRQMVVNGRAYDYLGIPNELQGQDYNFETDPDSDSEMVQHLRGEYAIFISDRRNDASKVITIRFGMS